MPIPSGFVFTTPTGTVLDPRILTRAFKAILTANNLPSTYSHVLPALQEHAAKKMDAVLANS